MVGPHWNPNSDEVAIVLRGQGMVTVVCPTIENEAVCKSSKFRVEEGDVFMVQKYHPMAQISFNNDSFVFIVFTITSKKNHSQYLAGKSSILRMLGKKVLAKSFDVRNTTIDQVMSAQRELAIFECTSCAEEEERSMEEGRSRGREGRGGRGGGGRRQQAEREGEMARREEEERERRQKEAEEAAGMGGVTEGEGGSYGHGLQ